MHIVKLARTLQYYILFVYLNVTCLIKFHYVK
jgi:hypothetical protein